MKLSIGQLSQMFGISRTTLLYYDKIGLLHPTARNTNGYRFYEDSAIHRLQQIMLFKNAGVPLKQISHLIASEESATIGLLMKQLGTLNSEINRVKSKQKLIISILQNTHVVKNIKNIDPQKFDLILKYAEIDPNKKSSWHNEFQKQSPEMHQRFLMMLGLDKSKILTIPT